MSQTIKKNNLVSKSFNYFLKYLIFNIILKINKYINKLILFFYKLKKRGGKKLFNKVKKLNKIGPSRSVIINTELVGFLLKDPFFDNDKKLKVTVTSGFDASNEPIVILSKVRYDEENDEILFNDENNGVNNVSND